ncbi:MAG: cbb3-type cytochrome c oxidase subunit II [Sulfuriferula sp.]
MAEITTTQPGSQHWFGMAYLLIFGAGLGFFLLSFIALGVLPGLRLADTIASHTKTDMPDYTAAELRGRQVYASLGCALCHTQQVRFVLADVLRWGAPTEAWETRYDFPQLWGTRRIGPDLARETGVRSDDWQLTHLYHPQSIVPDSVMPSYDWLFKGSPDRPTASASDLLAYLHTLGRARQAGAGKRTGPRVDSGLDPVMLMEIKSLCTAPFINANQAQLNTTAPSLAQSTVAHDPPFTRSSTLFTQNCAGCHGANGDGNGLAASGLSPRPANLRLHQFTTQGVAQVLWNGVPGSAMPAWRDLPVSDLASLTIYVQALHSAAVVTIPATASVLARGAGIYAKNCMICHGAQGRGNGSAGMLLLPRPADFTAMQPDTIRAIQVLNAGIPGTGMPPWTSLSSTDKQAVSAFIRTLYQLPEEQKP